MAKGNSTAMNCDCQYFGMMDDSSDLKEDLADLTVIGFVCLFVCLPIDSSMIKCGLIMVGDVGGSPL